MLKTKIIEWHLTNYRLSPINYRHVRSSIRWYILMNEEWFQKNCNIQQVTVTQYTVTQYKNSNNVFLFLFK